MEGLEDLVVSGKEMDQRLCRELLLPYLQLDKDACTIRPTAKWDELGSKAKIVLYLVARKAMKALDFPIPAEEVTPAEIIEQTGVKQGTVLPGLREMLKDRLIDQVGKRGGYLVPNHALPRIKSMLAAREMEGR